MWFDGNNSTNYGIRLSRVHNAEQHNWPGPDFDNTYNNIYSDNEPLAHLTEVIAYLSSMTEVNQVYNTLNRIHNEVAETLAYALQALNNNNSLDNMFSINRATLEELYKWGRDCTSNQLFSNRLISVSFDLDNRLYQLPAPLYMLLMTKRMVSIIAGCNKVCNLAVRCSYSNNTVITELFDNTGIIVDLMLSDDGFSKLPPNYKFNDMIIDKPQYTTSSAISSGSDINTKMPLWQLMALCSGCEITLNEHTRCTTLMLTHQLGLYNNNMLAANYVVG